MKEKEFLPLVASRLGISELNPMQRRMLDAASDKRDIVLLSPTGTGKTLAFLLPIIEKIKPLDMQLLYLAKAWLNKSRRQTAQVQAYNFTAESLNPLGNIVNRKY